MDYTLEQQKALAMANARKRQALATQTPAQDVQDPTMSKTGSFGMGIADVSSFGFDDELRGMGRALGSKFTDNPMTVDQSIQQIRGEHKIAQESNPNSYLAGQVTGGILPAIATRGQSLVNVAKNAPLLTKMGAGALQAAPAAAAYGVGSGEGMQDRATKGLQYGLGAATVGAAVPALIPAAKTVGRGLSGAADSVISGVKAIAPEEADKVARKMAMEGSDLYKQSKATGAILNKHRVVSIYNKMEQAVLSGGKLNARLHGDTMSVLDDLKTAVKSGDPVSLEELDQARQLLDEVIKKNTDIAGKLNPDGFRAVQAKEALDDSVRSLNKIDIVGGNTEAVDLLLKGRAKWAQKSKYEAVARVIKKANGDPAKLKAGFERFVNDPRKMKGFTKEEITALKAAGNNTMNEKILKGLGRFGVEPGNVFLPVVTGGLATMGGAAGVGAPLIAAGTVARQANKYVARGKADKALKAIEARQ